MKTATTKSERLTARATPEEKALIAHAAALRGRSITDFVIEAAQSAAREVVTEETLITLTTENQHRLATALLAPAPAKAALKSAYRAYDKTHIISR